MDTNDIKAQAEEARIALGPVEGIIRALGVFMKLELDPPTRDKVFALLQKYQGVHNQIILVAANLTQAESAIDVLLDSGFPALPQIDLDPQEQMDLDGDIGDLSLARKQFNAVHVHQAVGGEVRLES